MNRPTRAILYGCGAIGSSIAEIGARRDDLRFVGGVDTDPDLAGRDLGRVVGLGSDLGAYVSADLGDLVDLAPELAFHATGSKFVDVYGQLADLVSMGVNVISTCEELSYPYDGSGLALTAELDQLARKHQVTVLGTGVNPGFVMDAWPLFMSGVCQEVYTVTVVRRQDPRSRREAFRRKVGLGYEVDKFASLLDLGLIGHVGLAESIRMIAGGLEWTLDGIDESLEPVVAREPLEAPGLCITPGQVVGIQQCARGKRNGTSVITLGFEAYVGVRATDDVVISGRPDIRAIIENGIPGDVATGAILVNAHRAVVAARAGLLTMKDLPVIACGGRPPPAREDAP